MLGLVYVSTPYHMQGEDFRIQKNSTLHKNTTVILFSKHIHKPINKLLQLDGKYFIKYKFIS